MKEVISKAYKRKVASNKKPAVRVDVFRKSMVFIYSLTLWGII